MSILYSPASSEVRDLLADVIQRFHSRLAEFEVSTDLLWAFGDLKLHGYAAAAIARIVPYKQRVKGGADTEIVISKGAWDELSDESRIALLDHECQHFALNFGKEGLKRDDLGRPKLKMRTHDLVVGGFSAVVKRHGRSALESVGFEEVYREFKQLDFPFMDESEEREDAREMAGTVEG